MASTSEQILSRTLRDILEPLPRGASIAESDVREALSALEYFVPEILCDAFQGLWRSEVLDGFYLWRGTKNGPRSVDLAGMCILLSDQTMTPFSLRLRVHESVDEVEWLHFRLGEETAQGMLRVELDGTRRSRMRASLDVDATEWSYDVELERVFHDYPRPQRPRIYADFNGCMESPRNPSRTVVPLDTWGSLRDLANANVRLREGTRLVIHDDSDEQADLEALATAYYDPARSWWFAELEHDLDYVPAKDRSPVTSFLCLGCRADLGPDANRSGVRACPHCGVSILAPIAPP